MTTRKKLPKGWRWAKLDAALEIDNQGIRPAAGTIYRYIGLENIEGGLGDFIEIPEVDGREIGSGKYIFGERHILYGKLRPYLNKVALPEFDGICSTDILPLLPKSGMSKEYLAYWLRSKEFVDYATQYATGTKMPRLGPDKLQAAPIPLPPTEAEQERIVEVLRQADAIRRKRAEARRLADQILPALFLDMFGDPITNPKNWPVASLSDVLELIRNGTTSTQNTEDLGYPVSRIETISYETIDQTRVRWVDLDEKSLRKWRMESGDILFSHINSIEHIAKTALYLGDPPILIHGMNLLLLRPNQGRCLPVFLHALLKTPGIRDSFRKKAKQAVNQASLNQKDLKNQQMILPPLDEQKRFVYAAEEVQAQMEKQTSAVNDAERLFAVLLSRAFTGELTTQSMTSFGDDAS